MYQDVEKLRSEGEGQMEVTWAQRDKAEVIKVFMRWDLVKYNQKRVLVDHPILQIESRK